MGKKRAYAGGSARNSLLKALVIAATALGLGVTLLATGFGMCAWPDLPTRALSQAFSAEDVSPFTKDELVAAAVQGKHYTFNDNDRAACMELVATINEQAAADGRAGATAPDVASAKNADGTYDLDKLEELFATADEHYALTTDAMDHLDDCYRVVQGVVPWLLLCAALAIGGCAALGRVWGKKAVAWALRIGAGAMLAIFLALGAWIALDFNGFFAAFHSLFFVDGTWTFSWDSLLICMYPIEFWMGMGATWLATTIVACLVCLAASFALARKAHKG